MLQLANVEKLYQTAGKPIYALNNIDLEVTQGEFLAIVGKSGSGKSTLLNVITGIDRPSAGDVFVAGKNLNELNENQLAIWRGTHIGVVFQFFQLIPTLSIIENVMLPMDFCNSFTFGERKARALQLLKQVDILEQAYKFPTALSGGQQQRVAIARALANDPTIIVADEPTGNLDSATTDEIMKLFQSLCKQEGKTLIIVTHERDISEKVDRCITLVDGQITSDVMNELSGGRVESYV